MRRQLQIQPHLAIFLAACVGLAGATTYFLFLLPKRLSYGEPDWIMAATSWASAFVGQCGVFLAIVCPVAVHAVSGRWSWSVGLFAAVSAYFGLSMGMFAAKAYEDLNRSTGYVKSLGLMFEGAMVLASIFLFYLMFAGCTLAWVATRGRRYRFIEVGKPKTVRRTDD